MKHLLGLSASALLAFSPLEAEAGEKTKAVEERTIRKRCRAVGEKVQGEIQRLLRETGLLELAARAAGDAGQYAQEQCLRRNDLQPIRPKTEKKPPDDSSGNQSTNIIF